MTDQDPTLDDFVENESSEGTNKKEKRVRGTPIPSDWKVVTIDDISKDMGDGGTPSRQGESGYFGGDINWVVISDIEFAIDDSQEKLTQKGLENSSATLWPEGSVIVTTGASIGEVGIAKIPTATKQGITGIVPTSEINSHFFARYLEANKKTLNRFAQGTTFEEIRPYILKNVELPLLPLEEQRKIATVLYTVDQTIQKTEEIIEQMAKAKTAMVEELTMRGVGHADFKKADITPKYLDIEFPVSWEKVTYEEVTKNITYGFTNPMPEADSGPWMVTAKDIEDGRINYNTSRKTTEQAFSEKLTSKSRPEPGTVLVTKDGTLGRVAVVDKEGICINQSVASLNPIEEKVIPQFLALTIKSPLAKKLIEAYNPQTTIGHIKISELAEWEFGLPPLEEQREIVSIVNSARERYFAEQEYKSQLERLKQGLMQDLLSGEVRTHDTDIEIVDEVLQHG